MFECNMERAILIKCLLTAHQSLVHFDANNKIYVEQSLNNYLRYKCMIK